MGVTFYLIKNADTVSNPVNVDPKDKIYVSHLTYALSEEGQRQVARLVENCTKFKFDVLIRSTLARAEMTAAPVFEKLKEEQPSLTLRSSEGWNEVKMGKLDGLTAGVIKGLFATYNPGAPIPSDFNDCMNKPWEKDSEYTFENYRDFDKRIQEELILTVKENTDQVVGVFGHCEVVRTLVLDSKGTEEFFKSTFGQQLLMKLGIVEGDERIAQLSQKTLRELGLERAFFKPNGCSWIKLTADDSGETFLHASDNVVVK